MTEYKAKYLIIRNLIELVVGTDKSQSHRSTRKSPRPIIDVNSPSPMSILKSPRPRIDVN